VFEKKGLAQKGFWHKKVFGKRVRENKLRCIVERK
jgi:hypothetical protein